MVKEGYWFGLPPLSIGGVLLAFRTPLGLATGAVLVFLGLFVFYFFRNPDRKIPMEPGVVVSPADGRVVVVKDEENAGRAGKRVSIFLAIWNVHVNRSPAAGTISRLEYKPGKFLAAWAEKASLENEQNVFTLASEHGEIVFKQIAGWVARRVVSWKKTGDTVGRGELVGLVRFGSRVDLWLPAGAEIAVKVGENVKGGSSVIARMAARAEKS
ncbi:MAG TPA: phosphatidylserine decarboxylase family protein [Candidatus Acidoferrum sp.]|nr:phosphatidylserine decarboxylase family protein [Candidatus Acidoferrum sp.]